MTSTTPDSLTRKRLQLRSRKAVSTDFHDVMKINVTGDVFGTGVRGDYMRNLYPLCLKDPKILAHVHYVNREFVSRIQHSPCITGSSSIYCILKGHLETYWICPIWG